ncbi:MAG: sporulation transcriptional regulator SpoIIID [Oscillibacter sp.]|nr:sporulation transcriptional regulator SpoIIID [Oscillibacter sp.]
MKGNMEERACALAAYIIENRATVRAAAKKFGVSKSTVHTVDTLSVASIWCSISRSDRTKGGMLSMSIPPFLQRGREQKRK